MKHGSNQRRVRSRGQGRKNPKNHTYESNHPEIKVRGTAQQVFDRYMALARDASSAGDRIAAESHYQFAEHYFRILSADGGDQRNMTRNGRQSHTPADDLSDGQDGMRASDDFRHELAVDPDGPQPIVVEGGGVEGKDAPKPKRRAARSPRRSRTQRAADYNTGEAEARRDEVSSVAVPPDTPLPAKSDVDIVKAGMVSEQPAATVSDDETESLSA